MKCRFVTTILWCLLLCACGVPAVPPQSALPVAMAGTIAISEPRVRLPVSGQDQTAAYLTLQNNGAQGDSLVAVTSPFADKIELHAHIKTADSMMTMRQITKIDVPANATIPLSPGGVHIMIKSVKPGLTIGQSFPMTLTFASGNTTEIEVPIVENPKLSAPDVTDSKGAHQH